MTTRADVFAPRDESGAQIPAATDLVDVLLATQKIEQEGFAALRESVVMMVDDDPVLVDVLQCSLDEEGYHHFVATTDPREAIGMLHKVRPDVLFLDMVMPGLSGLEILRQLRADRSLCHIPVIVLTASCDPNIKLQALELGAADFLAKPVDPSELVLRLRNTLAAKAFRDQLTYYDQLTGLPNRRMFKDRLAWSCAHAQRHAIRGALLHVDLDRFKQINEALGPSAGDLLLKEIGHRFGGCIRATDAVMRSGGDAPNASLSRLVGDEFTVLLPSVDRGESAALVARRLLDVLQEQPFAIGGQEVFLTASIGVAVFPDDGADADDVLKNAGAALRKAKQGGRNQFKFYSKEFNARALHRLSIETELRRALERNELHLHYQPKVDTRSQTTKGAEVLVRWQHSERGLVSPAEFIPVAEASGLIVPLGEWVLRAAFQQAAGWRRNAGLGPVKLSVNMSALQLREPGLADMVARALRETGMAAEMLCIELTETVVLDMTARTTEALAQLHGLGIRLSIDDFGAGYTSLSYLKRLPFSELKVDKSFIDGIENDADSAAIVAAMIALAHNLGLSVVAEGVETQAQYEFLKAKGCDECQGYLFSKPISADAFAVRLREMRDALPMLQVVA